MPRGRKRKALLGASDDIETHEEMAEALEAALATAEAGVVGEVDEETEDSKIHEPGEITEDAIEGDSSEAVPPIEVAQAADELPPPVEELNIGKAQDELTNLDLLVCGKCHFVFHFIEELLAHKKSDCSGVSGVICNNTKADSKAQVWAFVLYKSHKLREQGEGSDWTTSSWQLYQKWSQLDDNIKKSWVEAGRELQQLSAYLQTPAKSLNPNPKPKVVMTAAEREQQQQTLMELQKELEDDTETQMMSTLGLVRGKGKEEREKPGVNQIWRKSLTKKGDDEEEELYTVEKIVAKRVNPKTRQPEYLVKWIGFPSDQNTWEHIQNMASCIKVVQEFEKNLARQKARKALEASQKLAKNVIRLEDVQTTPGGRPVRTSALKALDQVKEWVGGKRSMESEEEDEDEEPPAKRPDLGNFLKKKLIPAGKSPVIVANSRGVVRVDPKQVPNLSSGVYILSSQQGLIKVDDSTATKLTSCLNNDAKKITTESNRPVMINETEVRKIPAGQVTPKVGILRKEIVSGGKRENQSPNLNILQKVRNISTPVSRVLAPVGSRVAGNRQIILGSPKTQTRPLPGPVPSPLRAPAVKPKVTIKPAATRPKQPVNMVRVMPQKRTKVADEDFEGNLPDDFPKDDDPVAPTSPNRPLTLCPLTGEVLGRAEGEKTPEEDNSMPEMDDDGMMRVAVSPGGSIHQVIQQRAPLRPKQARSLLTQRRAAAAAAAEAQAVQQELQQQKQQEQELISIESEDGVIYQITPEQQQLLMQNGTLTMDSKQEDSFAEHTEILIENGQIMERRILGGSSEEVEQGEQTTMLLTDETQVKEEEGDGEAYSQDGNMLTLDSVVQEAVSQGGEQAEAKGDEGQMVAQIVQAEPPTPGGGPRKVVLLLPDGSLLETEMDEEQYQALDFEK